MLIASFARRRRSEQTSAQGSSDYFLDSADRIHFFAEKDALDSDGNVKTSEKLLALNKAGHGLHVCDDVFRACSTSGKVRGLVRSLGWTDPVIPQSMYIFKQPRIGGEVTSHQDSCFLHTEDVETGEAKQVRGGEERLRGAKRRCRRPTTQLTLAPARVWGAKRRCAANS